jgi:hypothetical protein
MVVTVSGSPSTLVNQPPGYRHLHEQYLFQFAVDKEISHTASLLHILDLQQANFLPA